MKSVAKTISRFLSYGERIEPARDWYVLLSLFFMFFAASAVWNAWLFNRVQQGGMLSGQPAQMKSAIPGVSLEEMEYLFQKRADEEERYASGAYVFTDPSR